jgi:hypothetical protein
LVRFTVAVKKKRKALPWKYCECGCHGNELELGGVYFWSLTTFEKDAAGRSLDDGKGGLLIREIVLRDAHGWWAGELIGIFKTYGEKDKFVRKYLRKQLKEIESTLR